MTPSISYNLYIKKKKFVVVFSNKESYPIVNPHFTIIIIILIMKKKKNNIEEKEF